MSAPSLEGLVARLEKAVERLENFEVTNRLGDVKLLGSQTTPSVAVKTEMNGASSSASAPSAAPASTSSGAASVVVALDALLNEQVTPLIAIARAAGSLVLEDMAKKYLEVFKVVRTVVASTADFQAPDASVLTPPLAAAVQAVSFELPRGRAKVSDPRGDISSVLNALHAASESCVAATWILIPEGKTDPMGRGPRSVVAEAAQAAEFYANKSLLEHRGKNENIVQWTRTLMNFLSGFEQFVVRHCPTGLQWRGSRSFSFEAAASGAAAANGSAAPATPAAPACTFAPPPAPSARPAGRGPPPPPPKAPPPPPPPSLKELSTVGGKEGAGNAGGGMAQLLSELNKGSSVTNGLRKVTSDMKSKNVNASSLTAAAPPPVPRHVEVSTPKTKAHGQAVQGTPKFELEQGSRWKIEHQVGRKDLEVVPGSAREVLYLYGCRDCVVQVRGKVNAISADSCSRVGVVFGDVISSFEVVNCSSLQIQCTGVVPTVSLDQTDGCQIFVSKKLSQDPTFQIVTAKSNSINVTVLPDAPADGADADVAMDEDPVEQPIPEQFITTFDANGKLKTVAAVHSGA